MKAVLAALFVMGALTFAGNRNVDAAVYVYAEASENSMQDFYEAASEYYRIPKREIVIIRERRVRDEEVPVVLFIAGRARVPYAGVLDMRDRGMSWMDITRFYRLNPDIYFATNRLEGPPYGRAYGYHKKDLRRGGLDDADIVNLVNVRFMSIRYGLPPDKIMRMRSSGRSFVVIHEEIVRRQPRNLREDRVRGDFDGRGRKPEYDRGADIKGRD
ncbi:MAG TPA: hypothetical protein VK448_04420 [Dissulfurispiraceae bacterium]|nr:hypothetical protein [Dissulfurispiraceae bacterium]